MPRNQGLDVFARNLWAMNQGYKARGPSEERVDIRSWRPINCIRVELLRILRMDPVRFYLVKATHLACPELLPADAVRSMPMTCNSNLAQPVDRREQHKVGFVYLRAMPTCQSVTAWV